MSHSKSIKLSKSLAYVLRHGAETEGLRMDDGGYIDVVAVLRLASFRRCGYTESDVMNVVETSDKQRFALRHHPETGRLQIRANQGHSIEIKDDGTLLTPISLESCPDVAIHGTYFKNWQTIQHAGLSKRGRNHIHFAAGFPGDDGVISGMRRNCEVAIVIDCKSALMDGLKFFRSENNVILCPGDSDGTLSPKYFKEVWQCRPRKRLL
ncbi:tRNA 2'-phosphotransferase 1-like [Ornithodoros turicata]